MPPGSNCVDPAQCCVGLTCTGNHCGTPPIDSGACSLDPGGTPCSQCIIGSCCMQTEVCLDDAQCASSLACYQRCVVGNTPPGQCKQQCCTGATCNAWAGCVEGACAPQCF